jgi:insertion element IS1 protein InsB
MLAELKAFVSAMKAATQSITSSPSGFLPDGSLLPRDNLQIQLICEVEEVWPRVGSKKQQRWLYYAWETRLKHIIAHALL